MAAVITLLDNPMSRHPGPGGDNVAMTILVAVDVNYPAGGEVLDLSPYVKSAVAMMFAGWGKNPAGGNLMIPVPQLAASNGTAWNLRFHVSGANAQDPLPEFAAGAYPASMECRFVVWGRPVTDAA